MDDTTDVIIEDTSDNTSTNVREYKLEVGNAYSISDKVEVTTPWDFEQIITFKEGDQ